jgi:hypothetical protein
MILATILLVTNVTQEEGLEDLGATIVLIWAIPHKHIVIIAIQAV